MVDQAGDNGGLRRDTVSRAVPVRPRFHVHFTPTGSSWLNQVGRWFALLTTKQLRRGTHKNSQALEKDIHSWITTWNKDPKPFI